MVVLSMSSVDYRFMVTKARTARYNAMLAALLQWKKSIIEGLARASAESDDTLVINESEAELFAELQCFHDVLQTFRKILVTEGGQDE